MAASDRKRDIVLPLHLILIALVISWSALRLVLFDWSDRYQCQALLNEGSWLDSHHGTWQPNGCMLHSYTSKELSTCLQTSDSKRMVFIGDSTVRAQFNAVAKLFDPAFDESKTDKHSDRSVADSEGAKVEFYWDPFLNGSATSTALAGAQEGNSPAMLVFGAGLWHLLHLSPSQSVAAYGVSLDRIFTATMAGGERLRLGTPGGSFIADEVVILPVQPVVEALLSSEKQASMTNTAINELNMLLRTKEASFSVTSSAGGPTIVEVPWSFNEMLGQGALDAAEESIDGIHFSNSIVKQQSNVLLNLRCNDFMPKKFPLDKTCCGTFPQPSLVQIFLLVAGVLLPLGGVYLHRRSSPMTQIIPKQDVLWQMLIFSSALVFIFFGDRTTLFLRASKSFHSTDFFFLSTSALAAGCLTLEKSEKGDLGFLNRQQTDEWKGWMQVAILIYHYTGASKISPIYNPIRAMVAAYLFMSGYGHFFFYYKKGDYSFGRVFSVLVRLNLLPVLLAYTMDTDWLSYYFSPLVTMWFLVIWVTMWVGNQYNSNSLFLLVKIVLSFVLVTVFFVVQLPLEWMFAFTNQFLKTEWHAHEWTFRVTLDLIIPYVGMLAALFFIKIQESRLTESMQWPQYARVGIYAAAAGMVGYVLFESSLDKFTYNIFHTYASILPVVAFTVLRNATPALRSVNSKFFMYFGQCSLETFIIQFHLWMAADTKGLLVFVPGTGFIARFFNFVICSLVFVFVSEKVATATGAITAWLSSTGPKPARPQQGAYAPVAGSEGQIKDVLVVDPPSAASGGLFKLVSTNLKVKMVLLLLALWVMNLLYPTESPPDGHLLPTH